MNKYKDTPQDIHQRIHKFVVSCFKDIVKKIPKTMENIPVIQQLSSALTSIGVNDQEADGALTKKDFIAKYSIVKKEAKETKYWLTFVKEADLINDNGINYYIQECHEILMIISKIINNTLY